MRVDGRGLVDRARPLRFSFDGRTVAGFQGDTVASALLAEGTRLMGRSFKYHRPRGPMTMGSEEPNALIGVIDPDGQRTPNVRATVQEAFDGLVTESQNRFPSLRFDALAVNDALAPFLGAGFYYKTFTWPRPFWEGVYEPLIRRAAGLGKLSRRADTAPYEKAWAFCDLLVIGAGPAGLMAALTAGRAGVRVILADEAARMGGRALCEDMAIGGQPCAAWAEGVLAELAGLPNVRLMPRTTVTGAYDHGMFSAVERVGLHLPPAENLPRECLWRIRAARAVLAAGATERAIAFQANDRPGVMMAGAARGYLHRYGVGPGRRVVVFANNDDARRTALDLHAAGISVTLVDSRENAPTDAPFTVHAGAHVIETKGRLGLEAVVVRRRGGVIRIDADCLAVSGGWNPVVHLTCHMNGRPTWDDTLQAFVPTPGSIPGLVACGAANGQLSTHAALAGGIAAATESLSALGLTAPEVAVPEAEDTPGGLTPLWQVPTAKGLWSRAWLDFANDVTVKDVALSAQEGFRSVEHMKRYTTQGMAPDQGRNSNVAALAVLADVTGRGIAEVGTTTFRPPFTPTQIATLGAGGRGQTFAPQRILTSDQASRDRGAPMIEAGLWYRPGYFPKPGETTWQQACDREVRMVRSHVGVADVSTLGKIDIQGADAGRFLDLVYTNTFSTLPAGRVRYGLMLREDGFVMDDGTSARLGEHHYLMTTTTAAAGQVMRHLDFVQAAFCADWDLRTISVTEAWAQFAVAGPMARHMLATMMDLPDLPFMGCAPCTIGGVRGRLFRISFSGETGYEIAVPTRYGEALFRDLVARAETLGGGPYGMEALNVLRIEKGFLTHAEIHGRVTADDVGLGRMLKKGDFIGKVMAQRPALTAPDREQLVGLRPLGDAALTAGAHLFTQGTRIHRETDQGYVTSVGPSPTLGGWLGLGFLSRGRERHGEVVRAVDHMRGVDLLVQVCDPVFHDPEGAKLRA